MATKLLDDQSNIAERYVHAIRGRMYFELTFNSRSDSTEYSVAKSQGLGQYRPPNRPVTVKSRDLYVLCAAGQANHWGTRLIRLKYGLDATEFKHVLPLFQDVAAETSTRLNWGDEELARFMARFVLLGWLIDRTFRGHGEWKRRCTILRKQLFRAEREASSLIALKLGR